MNDFSSILNDDGAGRSAQAALYALDAVSQTEARAVAQALPTTPALAAEVAAFEQVTGLLGVGVAEVTPPPALRRRLLNGIAGMPMAAANAKHQATRTAAPVSERMFARRASDTGWRSCGPGVFSKTLFVDRRRSMMTTLVRLAPGGRLPRHRHPEAEESFILSGSCTINGETFGAGDYRRAPSGTIDGEITSEDGVLFLMISATQLEVID